MMPYGIIGLGNKTPQSGQLSMHHGGGMSQSGGGLGIGGMGGGSSANLYGEGLQQARQQQVWAAQHDALYKKQKEAASFTTPHAAVWQQQAHQHPSQQQPQAVRKFQHFNDSAMLTGDPSANEVLQKLMKKYVNEATPSNQSVSAQSSKYVAGNSSRSQSYEPSLIASSRNADIPQNQNGMSPRTQQMAGQVGMGRLSNTSSTSTRQSSIPPIPSSVPSSVPSLNLGRVAPNSPAISNYSHTAPNTTGGGSLEKEGGNGGYQPQATRPSALSPRMNGRPASAPNYPRDNSHVPEPPFVPAEEYQLQIHQTAAFAMNSGDWQNLMVNSDGSYQKHEPWSASWIKSRGYIRAWLEFQAQADEDLRIVKEFPGVRQHTHHNEVSITQQKSLQDRPKMRKGRCLRWADEDELPDRVKKPTTPRDPRAFADRIHQQDPLTPNLTAFFPNSYNPSQQRQDNVNNIYAAPRHMSGMGGADTSTHGGGGGGGGSGSQPSYLSTPLPSSATHTSPSTEHAKDYNKDETSKHRNSAPGGDVASAERAGGGAMRKDRYVDPYTRAHHHRLNRPWGSRQAADSSTQTTQRARLDLSMLPTPTSAASLTPTAPTSSDPLGDFGSALSRLKIGGGVEDVGKPAEKWGGSRSDAPASRTVLHF